MEDRYIIEIYPPGESEGTPLVTLESGPPPLLPAIGDLVSLQPFPGAPEAIGSALVKVVGREHVFRTKHESDGDDEQMRAQKVKLYTAKVDDEAAARTSS